MNNDDFNKVLSNNPFIENLFDSFPASSQADLYKREGFREGKNNYNILNEREKYSIDVQNLYIKLISNIEQIQMIKVFIKRYPYKDFYSKNNNDQLKYIQYHLEVLFHKVHTILDIMKLMVNEVYCLGLENRECTWKSLKKLDKDSLSLKIIDKFQKAFINIIHARHVNTHRGIFDDKEKDEIDLDFGHCIYEMNNRIGIEISDEIKKIFPKYLIEYKIKEYRKKRIQLIENIQSIIFDIINRFLYSLNDTFLEKIKTLTL